MNFLVHERAVKTLVHFLLCFYFSAVQTYKHTNINQTACAAGARPLCEVIRRNKKRIIYSVTFPARFDFLLQHFCLNRSINESLLHVWLRFFALCVVDVGVMAVGRLSALSGDAQWRRSVEQRGDQLLLGVTRLLRFQHLIPQTDPNVTQTQS